jgi:choline dehydrogenase-like flavoprotein
MDGSDAEAFVRGCCGTLWHPAGGACRGDALDAESLELRGCEGVCVVGAAAMPALPRVNPSLSCYAMGWRLGELLAAE